MSLSASIAAQFKLIMLHKCMTRWSVGCVFHLSTAVLGYFLILVVSLAQVPVLFRMLRYRKDRTTHQDSSLISPLSLGLMAMVASNNVAYAVNRHLPISTWGEGILLLIQYLIIINLFLIHQGRHKQAVAFTLLYVMVMVGSLTPVIPDKILTSMKILNIPVDILRKVALMYKCFKHGVVSSRRSIAFLNVCTLGRLLTAFAHSHDCLLIAAYGVESFSTLLLTVVVLAARSRKNRKISENQELTEEVVASEEDEDGPCGTFSSGGSCSEDSCSGRESPRDRIRRRRRRVRISAETEMTEEEGKGKLIYNVSKNLNDGLFIDCRGLRKRWWRVGDDKCGSREGSRDRTTFGMEREFERRMDR